MQLIAVTALHFLRRSLTARRLMSHRLALSIVNSANVNRGANVKN